MSLEASETHISSDVSFSQETELHPQGIQGFLVDLRDKWENTIPEEIVKSTSENQRVKARHGWFHSVMLATNLAVEMGKVSDPNLLEQADNFEKYYTSTEFTGRLTNQFDVLRGNHLLTQFIDAMQQTKTFRKKRGPVAFVATRRNAV